MRRITLLTLLLTAVLGVPAVEACSCGPAAAACAAYWQLDAMFAGTVVDMRPAPPGAPGSVAVRFAVDQPGRGTSGDSAVIYVTPQDGVNCGYTFRLGERYVVRAHAAPGGLLTTTLCSGTRRAAEAAADIAFLREVTDAPRGGRVFGHVRLVEDYGLMPRPDRGPVAGARLRLTGDRTTREVVTGADGLYELAELPPGTYELAFAPPLGVALPGAPLPEEERAPPGPWSVTVTRPSECVERLFWVRTDSRLSGRLLAPDGSPAADERVDLMALEQAGNTAPDVPHVSTRTDADGRYVFAFIPPGRYLVGVNLAHPPLPTRIDRRAYYPGVAEAARATVVTVSGPGARLELGPLRLPAPATARVIEGMVRWPDGRPAAGAIVTLLAAMAEEQTTDDGSFRYVLPYGAQYTIMARMPVNNGMAYSTSAIVDREDRDGRVEIVLRLP